MAEHYWRRLLLRLRRTVAIVGAMHRYFDGPRLSLKQLTVFAMGICLIGCTTLRSIDGTPRELQLRIAAGELIKHGDRVIIDTSDGATHDFVIETIRGGFINGGHEAIPLEAIVSIQKRELSVGKTVGLAAGIVFNVALSVMVAVGFSHLGPGLNGG